MRPIHPRNLSERPWFSVCEALGDANLLRNLLVDMLKGAAAAGNPVLDSFPVGAPRTAAAAELAKLADTGNRLAEIHRVAVEKLSAEQRKREAARVQAKRDAAREAKRQEAGKRVSDLLRDLDAYSHEDPEGARRALQTLIPGGDR